MRWQLVVGVHVVLTIYVVIGGLMFWYLEEVEEGRYERRDDSLKSPFERKLAVVSVERELVSQLIRRLNETASRGLNCSL